MAGTKLDGAGAQKMKTIEEAFSTMQKLHGLVERMAIESKNKRPIGTIPNAIKRMAGPLQGQLKGQFGMIADLVSAMILATGRGGGEALLIRSMREYVGQIKQALDIAATKVKDHHSVEIEMSKD